MTDLDAAVARLTKWSEQDRNSAGARDARLLLADWERLREEESKWSLASQAYLSDAKAAEAERDAARAEVERLKAEAATADRMYIENHERFQALAATSRKLGQERDRLQSIFEATMADLHDPQHDKTSVFWRMNAALAQYAKEFP